MRVAAFALGLLLTRATPPVLLDARVEEVDLQTRHLGWHTDDVLIIGQVRPGVARRLALQVKRTFTIAASDEDCVETVRGMWDDFVAADRFDRTTDRLGIVTLHGTAGLLSAFTSLLDCARAAADGPDFRRRLTLNGYLSQKAKSQHEALLAILRKHVQGDLDQDEFWRFLRVVNVLSFDLGTPTAQTEAVFLSLLAHTAVGDDDPQAAAHASWAVLIELADAGRPAAASYRRDTLPADLVARHEAVPTAESRELVRLVGHGRTVRDVIRAGIGASGSGYTLERPASVAALLDALDEHRIVVVSGAAGSGKSALAKTVLARVELERPVLAFQAVEFAVAHLDETLANAQSRLPAPTLFALLAAHDRATVLIDGVERLLEHSVRDAFAQLLHHVAHVPALRLVLTCRDYALETVRSALLSRVDTEHAVLVVPPVTDDEFRTLAQAVPALTVPLRNARLRELLRTPYLLDLATRVGWEDAALPQTVRAFREKCWRELVRDEAHPAGGMPQRREDAFLDVARRRAEELRPFVASDVADPETLDALHRASLLERSPTSSRLYAPAHDVLEDWAILRWLDDVAAAADDPAAALAGAVGDLPAVRRGLRRWLAERLETDPTATSALVAEIVRRADLPPYFRDDCLVAVLLSNEAAAFLTRSEVRIAGGDRALLRQVIHLLRVACKTPLFDVVSGALPTELLVPIGPGWPPALDLVERHLLTDRPETDDPEAQRDAVLALGFVEDWSRQVSVDTPSPQGADTAGRIVAALLPRFGDYGVKELRQRALNVMLKIPRHVPNFLDLAARSRTDDGDDPVARDLGELLVSTVGSAMVARDFPGVVIDQLRAQFMLRPADVASHHRHAVDVDECFGIRDTGLSPFFPASALQGPFWALLRYHPCQAVDFVVELLNHAADWYGERRWPGNTLEPAVRVTLDVPNTGSVAQWANGRLYLLYRGQSVGPYILQSALMALETWLLEIAEIPAIDVEFWLLHILRGSNNVMASAVVASVCVAYPARAGRAALALLSCRDLFAYDLQRLVADRRRSTHFLTGLNAGHAIHEDERKRADARPHRREGLEDLAVRLQLTDAREAVWALIDRHRAAVPADAEDEADLVWRLALHRMDVRGYQPVDPPPPVQDGENQPAGRVYFGPGAPEPPLQQLVHDRQSEMAALSGHLRLLNKAHELWARSGAPAATDWQALLDEARAITDEEEDAAPEYARGGALVVASACLRDRRADMTAEEQAWCAERIARALLEGAGGGTATDDIDADRYSPVLATEPHLATVVPIIAADNSIPLNADRMELLATALTHNGDGVADSVYAGAALYLNDGLALRCAAAAVREGEVRDEEPRAERAFGRFGTTRPPGGAERVRAAVHEALAGDDEAARAVLGRLRFDSSAARLGTRRACEVLGRWPAWPEARAAFERVAAWLADTWARDRRSSGQRDRDHGAEQDLRRRLARFVLKCPPAVARAVCAPLVAQVAHTPREVADFVHELIFGADDGDHTDCFWALWQDFADATAAAPWATRLRRDDPYEQPLLDRLFLRTYWREGVTHWRRLEGHAHRLDALAARLPAVTGCVEAYTRFLYTVGRRSLPEAFLVLDEQFRRADATRVASGREVAYMLEVLLARSVYAEPLRLKTQPQLRGAVLRLLDVLVDAGSSSAYRVRDDFVTPARAPAA